jgi:Fe2+ transport system protein A
MSSENILRQSSVQSRKAASINGSGIPLAMAEPTKQFQVAAIRGKDDIRRFLTNLGFVEGASVTLISEMSGNVIVNVMGTRVAISRAMATRVLVN